MARLHESADRPLRAIRQYRLLVEANPLDAAAREALVQLYLRNGDRQAATEQLAELRKMAAAVGQAAGEMAIAQRDLEAVVQRHLTAEQRYDLEQMRQVYEARYGDPLDRVSSLKLLD